MVALTQSYSSPQTLYCATAEGRTAEVPGASLGAMEDYVGPRNLPWAITIFPEPWKVA
jgi:hypothetical protein